MILVKILQFIININWCFHMIQNLHFLSTVLWNRAVFNISLLISYVSIRHTVNIIAVNDFCNMIRSMETNKPKRYKGNSSYQERGYHTSCSHCWLPSWKILLGEPVIQSRSRRRERAPAARGRTAGRRGARLVHPLPL
uniref:Uncharacterized protein n=1 Tax=Arundo donax TaxID=35708 RepID=A0A0A9GBU5_ARUDO